jgi:hypothetical protein
LSTTTYDTCCKPFQDLNGSMTMEGDTVTAYTSDNPKAGAATIEMLKGPNLHFKVTFANIRKPFQVKADDNVTGNGYTGNATEGQTKLHAHQSPVGTEDNWTATDTGQGPEGH